MIFRRDGAHVGGGGVPEAVALFSGTAPDIYDEGIPWSVLMFIVAGDYEFLLCWVGFWKGGEYFLPTVIRLFRHRRTTPHLPH